MSTTIQKKICKMCWSNGAESSSPLGYHLKTKYFSATWPLSTHCLHVWGEHNTYIQTLDFILDRVCGFFIWAVLMGKWPGCKKYFAFKVTPYSPPHLHPRASGLGNLTSDYCLTFNVFVHFRMWAKIAWTLLANFPSVVSLSTFDVFWCNFWTASYAIALSFQEVFNNLLYILTFHNIFKIFNSIFPNRWGSLFFLFFQIFR